MPMTHNIALEAARSAASTYADASLARRRAYELLPVDGPDRPVIADALAFATAVARRAFATFVDSLADLHAQGGEAEAVSLILEVQDRTRATRTSIPILISEE